MQMKVKPFFQQKKDSRGSLDIVDVKSVRKFVGVTL